MIGKSFSLLMAGAGLLWEPAYLFRNVALKEPVCFVFVCVVFVSVPADSCPFLPRRYPLYNCKMTSTHSKNLSFGANSLVADK